MRQVLLISSFIALGSCGGRVSGPIGEACMSGGRSAASSALCSCVQRVADQELSRADQRRASSFFEDPQRAQDTRTRDDAGSEAFWRRYRTFADRAAASCG